MNRFCLLFLLFSCVQSMAQKKSRKEYLVSVYTNYGEMKAVLHDQTPLHKQNFLKLINDRFYDSLLFHRVIEGFMIQGGDPTSKKAKAGERLGGGGSELERVTAEIKPELFHKKGAIAAARNNNAEKKSSGCQFYIVQGRVWDAQGLSAQLKRGGRVPTAVQKEAYTTIGGSPHLDGEYTVFGQVISGLSVIDSISRQPKDQADRPLKDMRMSMTAKKMKKKKITKLYGYVFE